MATENDTSSAEQHTDPRMRREFQYETERESPYDLLCQRLYQAAGLSTIIYGGGRETFETWAPDIQKGVLWTLHTLILDAKVAAERLPRGAA